MFIPIETVQSGLSVQEKRLKKRECTMKRMRKDPDLLEKYDFSHGIRGKYTKRFNAGTNVVIVDPDVSKYFPDHDSVNQALRSLTDIIRRQKTNSSPRRILKATGT